MHHKIKITMKTKINRLISVLSQLFIGDKDVFLSDPFKADLKELVRKEAYRLKRIASKEELSRLNFDEMYPTSKRKCIYGQMTGDCFSDRAEQMIEICCPVYFGSLVDDGMRNRKQFLGRGPSRNFSAIENYIASEGRENGRKGNKALIAYLKGETKTLNI